MQARVAANALHAVVAVAAAGAAPAAAAAGHHLPTLPAAGGAIESKARLAGGLRSAGCVWGASGDAGVLLERGVKPSDPQQAPEWAANPAPVPEAHLAGLPAHAARAVLGAPLAVNTAGAVTLRWGPAERQRLGRAAATTGSGGTHAASRAGTHPGAQEWRFVEGVEGPAARLERVLGRGRQRETLSRREAAGLRGGSRGRGATEGCMAGPFSTGLSATSADGGSAQQQCKAVHTRTTGYWAAKSAPSPGSPVGGAGSGPGSPHTSALKSRLGIGSGSGSGLGSAAQHGRQRWRGRSLAGEHGSEQGLPVGQRRGATALPLTLWLLWRRRRRRGARLQLKRPPEVGSRANHACGERVQQGRSVGTGALACMGPV